MTDLSDNIRYLQAQINRLATRILGPVQVGPDDGSILFVDPSGATVLDLDSTGQRIKTTRGVLDLAPELDRMDSENTNRIIERKALQDRATNLETRATNVESKNATQDSQIKALQTSVGTIGDTASKAVTQAQMATLVSAINSALATLAARIGDNKEPPTVNNPPWG